VVLRAWSGVDSCPAVLTVVAKAVDVATEVGSVAPTTMHPTTLVTHLIVKDIWLHLNLGRRWERGEGLRGSDSSLVTLNCSGCFVSELS